MSQIRSLSVVAVTVAGALALTGCRAAPSNARANLSSPSVVPAASPAGVPLTSATTAPRATAPRATAPDASAPVASAPAPTGSAVVSPVASAAAVSMHSVVVYYLGDTTNGPRLYREVHRHGATTAVVRQAVNAMLHDARRDPDYVSVWPKATTLRGVSIRRGVATVDFSSAVKRASVGGEFELMALQQLMYTVRAAAHAVTAVHIRVNGANVETLWGHADTSGNIKPRPSFEVLAPVQINSPVNGRSVSSPLTIRGVATVFEATVSWQVLSGSSVVRHGFVNASIGAPGRGSWFFVVKLPKGVYTVKAFESSAKDGSETFIDTKRVTVR